MSSPILLFTFSTRNGLFHVHYREKKLERERVKALEQDLRRREQETRKKEIEFDDRLNNEMTK